MAHTITIPFIHPQQHRKRFYLIALPAADLVCVSYVARRGVDDEEGAVQRLLNPARIAGIRDFVLAGGVFPTSVVLNWTETTSAPKESGNRLVIQRNPRSAQIIDGQHRIVGLAAAIEKEPSLARFQVPVSLYSGLSTKECADIFLSINTEQKPVHRSLVFDLYSLASDYVVDPPALRAGDLAKELNENNTSPYMGFIKFPGAPAGQKGLALSTVVSSVKPLVEEKGVFEQVGLTQLQMQAQFIMNFFNVLRDAYGMEWESPTNVFRSAAGFVGAVEFIKNKLVVHCNIKGDFTSEAIAKVLKMTAGSLIRRDSIEGLQGRRAFTRIAAALEDVFDPTEGKAQDQGMTGKSGNNSAAFFVNRIPLGTLPKVFFASYSINARDEAALRAAASQDARRFVYNAAISFISGVAGLHTQQAAWAVTKMYYTTFYVGRAALCRSGLVIFHVPKGTSKGNTQYVIRIPAGEQAAIVDKPASTHKLVADRFRKAGYPHFMRSLQVAGDDPLDWLMDQREYWQYRAGRFPDPEVPDVLEKIDPAIMPRLLAAYAADTLGLYLADTSHALVSIPFRLLLWALSQDSLLSPGVVEVEDVRYLRAHCRVGGRQLGALYQCLPQL